MTALNLTPISEAVSHLYMDDRSPVVVIGNHAIRQTFDKTTLTQAYNARMAPGVTNVVINPDAHVGFGAPIGCVLCSPDHIYPGPVGVDIKCSMSLIQFDLPTEALSSKPLRRAVINAIEERITTGFKSNAQLKKARHFSTELIEQGLIEGASEAVLNAMGIPVEWTDHCEDSAHTGHDNTHDSLSARLEWLKANGVFRNYEQKLHQLGSLGGGNHFGECENVLLADNDPETIRIANSFGLRPGHVAFLTHCGSRGFGNILGQNQFRLLREKFELWGIPFPGGDKELVYAPVGTPEANNYLDDMALAGNFAVLNHLLINVLIQESFEEFFPEIQSTFVYYISHNFIRYEPIGPNFGRTYVHRKGATRAYPAGHPALSKTPYYTTGHPILLPGNPTSGSAVMVALEGAKLSQYSINHGAGRAMGRKEACRTLNQAAVDEQFSNEDIITNCRKYPLDEAPASYKNFNDVLESVRMAGLARPVARLNARFVIKDDSPADD